MMMKIDLNKIKNSTRGINFFWQTSVIVFLGALIVVLVVSLVWWFNLEQGLDSQTVSQTETKANFDQQEINQVLVKIENRVDALASTTNDLPLIIDPSL